MKKIIVQTVYYNCDADFIEDYVNRLCAHNDFPQEMKSDLLAGEEVGFRSGEPGTNAYAVTRYVIEDQYVARDAEGREK